MVYNIIMKICIRCKDRAVVAKNKCVRCYYAVKNGFISDFQRREKQNFIKDDVCFLGNKFIVDKDIFDKLKFFSWVDNGNNYARNSKLGYLHRNVVPFQRVDHINQNTLDNRKENLREGRFINSLNTDKKKKPCPIYKNKQGNWYAQTQIEKKRIYIQASSDRKSIVTQLEQILESAGRLHFYQLT